MDLSPHFTGDFFANVNNSEVGENRLFNRGLVGSASSSFYVIFEYDGWPAPSHWFSTNIYGSTFEVGWRSYNSVYDKRALTGDEARPRGLPYGYGLEILNSEIEYNIKN